ncbi:MAG: DUF2024 family protein [Planctomycetaceae bacterium]|jgi:hypothetical protein
MRVDVYDTYATGKDQQTIHFDVLVPTGTTGELAFKFAREFLAGVGLSDAELKQSRCNFCHTEDAGQDVMSDIETDGYHILRMEGCP